MNQRDYQNDADRTPADSLLGDAVCSIIQRLHPRRVLAISAHPDGMPELDAACTGLLARVDTRHMSGMASLECRAGMLPFEDQAFNLVIVQHVLCDGNEPELDEIKRILRGDGQVIAIGRGRFGMRGEELRNELPHIDARALCRNLRQREFLVRQCEGFGVFGRPAHLAGRWTETVLPFSDAVLVRGQHEVQRPVVTPLRFSRPQTAGMQSTAAEGLRRQAAS